MSREKNRESTRRGEGAPCHGNAGEEWGRCSVSRKKGEKCCDRRRCRYVETSKKEEGIRGIGKRSQKQVGGVASTSGTARFANVAFNR